jgi:hypothetical protein
MKIWVFNASLPTGLLGTNFKASNSLFHWHVVFSAYYGEKRNGKI